MLARVERLDMQPKFRLLPKQERFNNELTAISSTAAVLGLFIRTPDSGVSCLLLVPRT
jgi:hypothetical protein